MALKPHLVHIVSTYVDEDQSEHVEVTPAVGDTRGKVRVKERTAKVRVQVVDTCPDCGRSLSSRGDVMVCPQVKGTTLHDDKAGHQGCVIACGEVA